jgi:hypothetical protein
MAYGAIGDRRSELDDPLRNGSRVRCIRSLLGERSDAIQIGVITPDQLDQDGFFGLEVVIQASREDPGGVGDLLEGGAQTRGGDQRGRRFEDLGSASAIGLPSPDAGHECPVVLHSGHSTALRRSTTRRA